MRILSVCLVVGIAMASPPQATSRWRIEPGHRLVWDVAQDASVPHSDHVEMSGKRVSVVVTYGVDADRHLSMSRLVLWPDLRTRLKAVRGYLQHSFTDAEVDLGLIDGVRVSRGTGVRVEFNGTLRVVSRSGDLEITSEIVPSGGERLVVERVSLHNLGSRDLSYAAPKSTTTVSRDSETGPQLFRHDVKAPATQVLEAGGSLVLDVTYAAATSEATFPSGDFNAAANARRSLMAFASENLVLETPDNAINEMFHFAKIRASDSLFETQMGLVHSPGGGRYYGGIWANDQAEYSGPFFPFFGYADGNRAALTAYRVFAAAMKPDFTQIPYSFEVEGYAPYSHVERGDAAMFAYGASRFALVNGDSQIAAELWPAIQWSLEFCRRKKNAAGVITSQSDELEGRFPSGTANLATSSLAYGAWLVAANLADELGHAEEAETLRTEAAALKSAIEKYFGATVEGFDTYRYFEGNDVLRSWISLPMVMGITDRAEATTDAMFSPQMWSADGLATISGDTVFWDRATLYGLNGVFRAGLTDRALEKLVAYSNRRLLQDHIPYAVEASPEGNQAHLSAESALYARTILEGLFGLWPTGFRSFDMTVRLPSAWDGMAVRKVNGFGQSFDVELSRSADQIDVIVRSQGRDVVNTRVRPGVVVRVEFER